MPWVLHNYWKREPITQCCNNNGIPEEDMQEFYMDGKGICPFCKQPGLSFRLRSYQLKEVDKTLFGNVIFAQEHEDQLIA